MSEREIKLERREKRISRRERVRREWMGWLGGEKRAEELFKWQREQDENYRNKDFHNCPVLYGHF
jgi:hypothetical protein